MKRRTPWVVTWLLPFAAGIIAGGVLLAPLGAHAIDWPFGGKDKEKKAAEEAAPFVTAPSPAPIVGATPPSFVELAKRLTPAVVNISTTKEIRTRTPGGSSPHRGSDPFQDFFDQFRRNFGDRMPKSYRQSSLGSGFIVSTDGYIITNNHVVERADEIKVVLNDKQEFEGKVVGTDPKTDLALVKIEAKDDLPTVALGDSDALEIGEWVVAIGNPFGFSHTVTAGIVSAKGRYIGAGPYDDFIQTDASINPGNSGGPLFNMRGDVVGINTAIIAGGQGIGFATPINIAKTVVTQLKNKGKVSRGWLGVQIQDIDPDAKKFFDLKDAHGALVSQVFKDSPADKAGFKRDDVIVRFDGKDIESSRDLPIIVSSTTVGKAVEVEVIRGGKHKTLEVTLGEMPDESVGTLAKRDVDELLGVSVQTITPELAENLRLEDTQGVVVTGIEFGGPAQRAGIRKGDVISEVNRVEIQDVDGFYAAMDKSQVDDDKKTETILLLVHSGQGSRYVALKIPRDKD
ncbi:MAG: DegQ family serine endoprotease [Myxococcales bacterium]|nr:DegQ family serine endoprotease [Myxococcales bacterium]